jgi:signal transduction histidine kinase
VTTHLRADVGVEQVPSVEPRLLPTLLKGHLSPDVGRAEGRQAWLLLNRAGVRVADDPKVGPALTDEDRRRAMAVLLAATRRASRGLPVRLRDLPPHAPARAMLDLLRTEFVAELARHAETALLSEAVGVLQAIDLVQRTIDQDCVCRAANRLAGPEALELLVEVAHDMRSPLGAIMFLSEQLRSRQSGPLNNVQERQLGLVYSATLGLVSLVNDVVELARAGDRLVDHSPAPFSIADTVQSVLGIVHSMAEEKGLTIKTELPEIDPRIGHAAALSRVLLNLTTNALKFTPSGVVHITGRRVDRTRVEFSVRDTGRGIPPNVLAGLFDAFRPRQSPRACSFSSAGLGLEICQKLVSAMGGELQVETALGKGTRFFFELDLPLAARL